MDLTTLFCHIDDLVQARKKSIQLEQSKPPGGVSAQISLSELMTIMIAPELKSEVRHVPI